MIQGISFYTPMCFGQNKTWSETVIEKIENYFYLGGNKAHLIQACDAQSRQEVILTEEEPLTYLWTSCKIASFVIGFPLFLIKILYRYNYVFHEIDPVQKLSHNINITPEIIKKIEELMPIINKKICNHSELVMYSSSISTIVFSINSIPGLIFKLPEVKDRFQNMVKALKVCLVENLDHLIIPSAKLFEIKDDRGGKISILAEKFLAINPNPDSQEGLHAAHSDKLDKAISQVALLILKTGLHDIAWRNLPIFEDTHNNKLACIDLEQMGNAKQGFFGGGLCNEVGLLNCLFSEKQIDSVISLAKKHGIIPSDLTFPNLKKDKEEKKKFYRKLSQFHCDRGLSVENAFQHINANIQALSLNLYKEVSLSQDNYEIINKYHKGPFSISGAFHVVIEFINSSFKSNVSEKGTVESLRKVRMATFAPYSSTESNANNIAVYANISGNPSLLDKILKSLVDKGYIFSVTEEGCYLIIHA